MEDRTRVVFIDDSIDIRELYQRLIDRSGDLECVGTLESTVGLEDLIQRTRAGIAVVDLIGPGRDAVEAIQSVASCCPECRVIAFSGHDDDATRDAVFQAGAWSLVSKQAHMNALVEEIRRVRAL